MPAGQLPVSLGTLLACITCITCAGYPTGFPIPLAPGLPTTPAGVPSTTTLSSTVSIPLASTSTGQTTIDVGTTQAPATTTQTQTPGLTSVPSQTLASVSGTLQAPAAQGWNPAAIQNALNNAAGQAAAAVGSAMGSAGAFTNAAGQAAAAFGSAVGSAGALTTAAGQTASAVGSALGGGPAGVTSAPATPTGVQSPVPLAVSTSGTSGTSAAPAVQGLTPGLTAVTAGANMGAGGVAALPTIPPLLTANDRPNPQTPGVHERHAEVPESPGTPEEDVDARKVDLEVFSGQESVKHSLARQGTWWWSGKASKPMTKDDIKAMDAKYPYLPAKQGASTSEDAPTWNPSSTAGHADLENLNDADLYKVFTRGIADMPSALPGEEGMWTFCYGEPLINAFTNDSWPNGVWPQGVHNPFNNVASRVWRGKVLHTPVGATITQLWNLIWSNSTVAIVANVTREERGLSEDGMPSAVINYGVGEQVFNRPLRDEIRRVGPSTWLGRAWITDPVKNLNPTNPLPFTEPILDLAMGVENATFKAALVGQGIQGPNSSPKSSGGYYPDPGQPMAVLYFSLECINDAVPKLFYTAGSEASALITSAIGYNAPFYRLPALNPSAGSLAVENWSLEFPTSTDSSHAPFIVWPWKWSDAGPIGYLKVPALPYEWINGAWWLYNGGNPGALAVQPNVAAGQGTIQPTPSLNNGLATSLAAFPNLPSMFNNPGPLTYP